MATGEALLARLSSLFHRDPLIDEVGLLFGIEPSDLTPDTAFVLDDHKLGVAFAAGIPLFQAARTQFHSLNSLLRQEVVEMTESEDNGPRVQLLHCTRAILLINADFYTAWNTRKSFVARGWLDAQDEMQFTNLVLTLHPKSIDTWAYRRWLAIRLCESLSGDDLRAFYEQQIEVSSQLAERKARNYHAWSFRHWIVSRLPLHLTLKELDSMERWCRTHVSDHSGWNHRQHTLNELAKHRQDVSEMEDPLQKPILAELKFVSEIMALYPTHEALWCHRRYVMQRLLKETSQGTIVIPSSVLVLISQVVGTLSNSKADVIEAAALSSSWDEVFKMLSSGRVDLSSVMCAILREIEVGWKLRNRFSRRYAMWCLARLRTFLRGQTFGASSPDDALKHELSALASSLHEQLVHEDSVLGDLWHCTA